MCRNLTYLVSFVLVLVLISNVSAGLVAHWQFDEGSGTTTVDSSGNGHDGTLLGDIGIVHCSFLKIYNLKRCSAHRQAIFRQYKSKVCKQKQYSRNESTPQYRTKPRRSRLVQRWLPTSVTTPSGLVKTRPINDMCSSVTPK